MATVAPLDAKKIYETEDVLHRAEAAVIQVRKEVLAESPVMAFHYRRVALAQLALASPKSAAYLLAVAIHAENGQAAVKNTVSNFTDRYILTLVRRYWTNAAVALAGAAPALQPQLNPL